VWQTRLSAIHCGAGTACPSVLPILQHDHHVKQRLEPTPIRRHAVGRLGPQGLADTANLGLGEFKILQRERPLRIPREALLAVGEIAFEFDGAFLLRREREFVLDGPDGANGGNIAALGAKTEWRLQGLA